MTVVDSTPSDSSESSTYSESVEELLVASAEALVEAVCRRDVTGLMRLLDLPLGKKSVNDVSMDHGTLLATPLQVCMLLCRVRELACLLWECSQPSTEEPLSFDNPFDGIPVLHLGLNLAPDASLLRFTYLLLFLPELLRRHQRNPDDPSIQSVLAEAVAVCLLVSPSKYVDFEVGYFPVEAIENIEGEVLEALNNISGQWLTIVDRWKEKPESAPSWSVDVDVTDDQGLTLLVLACRRKAVNIIDILLLVGARVDVLDDTTHLPLEHAIASGLDGPVLSTLLDMTESSDRIIISQRAEKTKIFKLCMRHQSWSTLLWYIQRLQSEGAITEEDTEVLSSLAEDLGSVLMLHTVLQESGVNAAHSNVCVFTSKACYVHLGVEPHDLYPSSVLASNLAAHLSQTDIRQVRNINGKFPENPTRMEVLLDPQYGLLRRANLPIVEVNEPANLVDLLRVHDWSYLHSLMLAADASVTPSHDAMISRVVPLDADTAVTAGSWLAASCAAKAVVEAAASVCKGDTKRAFCCIRPPGHHIGVYGACQPAQRPGEVTDEDMAVGSQGFCLLNNVAVGVAYVKANFPQFPRIAIVDFDIHHGNGTEHIISHLGPRKRQMRTPITTGVTASLEMDECRLWGSPNDPHEILFASLHVADVSGDPYPGTGFASHDNILNYPLSEAHARTEMRSAVVGSLVPKLLKFAPDMMFLSAGFDGHAKDIIHNGRGGYTYQDIHWLTEILVGVANSCCEGRLVSVLEGGYNTKALSLSPFARSVGYHVDVLSRCPVEWDVEKMLRFYRSEADLFRREREAMAEAMALDFDRSALDFDRSALKHQLDNAEELLPHPKRPRSMRSSALKALDEIKQKISAEERLRSNAGDEGSRADSSLEGLDGVNEESNYEEPEGLDADGEEIPAPDDESDAALVHESPVAEPVDKQTPTDSEEDVVLLSAVATHTIDDDLIDVEDGWAQEKQVLV